MTLVKKWTIVIVNCKRTFLDTVETRYLDILGTLQKM